MTFWKTAHRVLPACAILIDQFNWANWFAFSLQTFKEESGCVKSLKFYEKLVIAGEINHHISKGKELESLINQMDSGSDRIRNTFYL